MQSMNMDQGLLLFVQEHLRSNLFTSFVVPITLAGDNGLIWILILGTLMLRKNTRRLGMMAGLSFLLCVGLAEVVKYVAERPRPFLDIAELAPLVAKPASYSFPSVHTVSSFSVAWILLWTSKSIWRYLLFLFAFLMAFSRIYVGVHYPSDVLAGFLIAWIGSYGVWRWARKHS